MHKNITKRREIVKTLKIGCTRKARHDSLGQSVADSPTFPVMIIPMLFPHSVFYFFFLPFFLFLKTF